MRKNLKVFFRAHSDCRHWIYLVLKNNVPILEHYSEYFDDFTSTCWLSGEQSLPFGLLILPSITRNFIVSAQRSFLFSSGCLGQAALFYCGSPWAFHITVFYPLNCLSLSFSYITALMLSNIYQNQKSQKRLQSHCGLNVFFF